MDAINRHIYRKRPNSAIYDTIAGKRARLSSGTQISQRTGQERDERREEAHQSDRQKSKLKQRDKQPSHAKSLPSRKSKINGISVRRENHV